MKHVTDKVVRFLLAEDGPTTVEYAFMLMLILLACLAAVQTLGQSTLNSFEESHQSIESFKSSAS